MCITGRHNMTLAVKVALNPNTINDKILDWSKFKAFADDKLNLDEKLKRVLGWVEDIVGNGENAGYQHVLLFP